VRVGGEMIKDENEGESENEDESRYEDKVEVRRQK
jgi:hypothetical protein